MLPRSSLVKRTRSPAMGDGPAVRDRCPRRVPPRAVARPERGTLLTLLLRYHQQGGIFGFVRRRCRSREDAEDAAQDTMVLALHSLDRFRGESHFGTWLHVIAANACRRQYRRGVYEPPAAHVVSLENVPPAGAPPGQRHELTSPSATPEQFLLRAELAERLEGAIARLPEKYRGVVLLCDAEGWSGHATAVALRLSVPAVKSRLHRARLFLRRALAGYVETEGRTGKHRCAASGKAEAHSAMP